MINYKILEQNFETILVQIGAIITLELENQVVNFYNTDCEGIDVYVERSNPIDQTELAMITVGASNGTYSNQHAGYVDGLYTYNIDVWTNSKSIGDAEGDELAAFRRNRITGIVRAILEDPIYKTLGFTPGSIGNLKVKSFDVGTIKKGELDALNTTVSRIVLELKASEVTGLIVAPLVEQAITTVKLGLTDFGYKYEFIE